MAGYREVSTATRVRRPERAARRTNTFQACRQPRGQRSAIGFRWRQPQFLFPDDHHHHRHLDDPGCDEWPEARSFSGLSDCSEEGAEAGSGNEPVEQAVEAGDLANLGDQPDRRQRKEDPDPLHCKRTLPQSKANPQREHSTDEGGGRGGDCHPPSGECLIEKVEAYRACRPGHGSPRQVRQKNLFGRKQRNDNDRQDHSCRLRPEDHHRRRNAPAHHPSEEIGRAPGD